MPLHEKHCNHESPLAVPPPACEIFFDVDQAAPTRDFLPLWHLVATSVARLDTELILIISPHCDGRHHIRPAPEHCGLSFDEITEPIQALERLSNRHSRHALRDGSSEYAIGEPDGIQFSVRFALNLFLDVNIRGCGMSMHPKGFELNFHFFYSRVPESTTASREKAMLVDCPQARVPLRPIRSL